MDFFYTLGGGDGAIQQTLDHFKPKILRVVAQDVLFHAEKEKEASRKRILEAEREEIDRRIEKIQKLSGRLAEK